MTRVLLDANVLFPTVLREILCDLAATGAYQPLWSARILEEWARAAARLGDEPLARAEIARLVDRFPQACVRPDPATEARLSLPDPDDIHVLAAAIDGRADELLTANLSDFPTRTLAREGVVRRDPDGFLVEAFDAAPEDVARVLDEVIARARGYGIAGDRRAILRRARLRRLARRMG